MRLIIYVLLILLVAPTKSPGRTLNGRDNTEAIDMEMSDEDFDTLPEFLEDPESMSLRII